MENRSWNNFMELFKTTGVLDESILNEVAKRGIPKSEKWAAFICFTGSLLLSAAGYPAFAAFFFSVGMFFILWQLMLFKRITIKKNLCNMQELNGVSAYQYTTWFDEEGMAIWNRTNHGEGKIKYTFLKRIYETEHIFAVQTKNGQFIPVFKSGLSLEEMEELTSFIKTRNGKINIDRLKNQK